MNHIRTAKIDDTLQVVGLARRMHAESTFKDMNFNPNKIADIVDYSTDEGSVYFVAVAEDDSGVYGFMLGAAAPSFFGDDIIGGDLCIYVDPAKRGLKAAMGMIKLFGKFCDDRNAKRTNIGSSAGLVDRRYLKLLERLGYEESGFIASTFNN